MRVLTKERIIESQDIEFTNESVIRVKENKLYYKVDNDMEIIKRQLLEKGYADLSRYDYASEKYLLQ